MSWPHPRAVPRRDKRAGRPVTSMGGLLIVNADDWGYDRATTDAIERAFEAGRITSATGMVHMADSARAAELANRLGRAIGLHINLTQPFSDPDTPERVRQSAGASDRLSGRDPGQGRAGGHAEHGQAAALVVRPENPVGRRRVDRRAARHVRRALRCSPDAFRRPQPRRPLPQRLPLILDPRGGQAAQQPLPVSDRALPWRRRRARCVRASGRVASRRRATCSTSGNSSWAARRSIRAWRSRTGSRWR